MTHLPETVQRDLLKLKEMQSFLQERYNEALLAYDDITCNIVGEHNWDPVNHIVIQFENEDIYNRYQDLAVPYVEYANMWSAHYAYIEAQILLVENYFHGESEC